MSVVEAVGMADKVHQIPSAFSGGQQQRVAIARALMGCPSLILADEPTGNLDDTTGQQIIELLESLNAEGKTLIIVTHDMTLAERATRMIKMKDGEVESQ